MTRDEVIRMANDAGLLIYEDAKTIINHGVELWLFGEEGVQRLERFATLVAAETLARATVAPIVVKTADIDPALLRDMLAKVPAMHLVPAPEPTHEAIAAAVADEREACAQVCESEWATEDEKKYGDALAYAIRARGAT